MAPHVDGEGFSPCVARDDGMLRGARKHRILHLLQTLDRESALCRAEVPSGNLLARGGEPGVDVSLSSRRTPAAKLATKRQPDLGCRRPGSAGYSAGRTVKA